MSKPDPRSFAHDRNGSNNHTFTTLVKLNAITRFGRILTERHRVDQLPGKFLGSHCSEHKSSVDNLARVLTFPLLLALLLSPVRQSYAQTYVARNLWQPFISVGYGAETFGDMNSYYDGIVGFYRNQGIQVPTQTDLGRTVEARAGILYSRIKPIWIGLSLGYSYSPAFSYYNDYAGTLKINGSVRSFDISLVVQHTLTRIMDFPLVLDAIPGVTHVSYLVTQDIEYANYPQDNYHSTLSDNVWGPSLKLILGTRVPLGNWRLSAGVGYDIVLLGTPTYSVQPANALGNEGVGNPNQSWSPSPSGFIFVVTCSTIL